MKKINMSDRMKAELVFVVFAMILTLSCDYESLSGDKRERGKGRIFVHPETGVEYYYEVPRMIEYVRDMAYICEQLDFDGGGWHWTTIDELRALQKCPALSLDGECGLTESGDCTAYSCNDPEKCNCDDYFSSLGVTEEEYNKMCHMIIEDPDMGCDWIFRSKDNQGYVSSTPSNYSGNTSCRRDPDVEPKKNSFTVSCTYWSMGFGGRVGDRTNEAYQGRFMCARDGK